MRDLLPGVDYEDHPDYYLPDPALWDRDVIQIWMPNERFPDPARPPDEVLSGKTYTYRSERKKYARWWWEPHYVESLGQRTHYFNALDRKNRGFLYRLAERELRMHILPDRIGKYGPDFPFVIPSLVNGIREVAAIPYIQRHELFGWVGPLELPT